MRKVWGVGTGLLVLTLTLPMCTGVPLTAPSNADISLRANPTFIPANGGVSVITAVVIEPAGTPVPNGTVVFFVTDLGRIDGEAKTKDGIARVNLVSDSRSGTANVTGFSGGPAAPGPSASPTATPSPRVRLSLGMATAHAAPNTDTIQVTIGSKLPVRAIVTANPARITSPRSALITANVFDGSGNPVANVPVFFSITDVSTAPIPTTTTTTTSTTSSTTTTTTLPGGGLEETLESGGAPQFTDTNGQAFDWLRTRAVPGGPQKKVTVTATTSNGTTGTVDVFIN